MCVVLFCRSLREVVFLVGEAYICDTSVLFRCYYAFVLTILEYCSCSLVWGSAAECYLQLLDLQVYLVARLCSDHSYLSLCRRRHVAGQCMLYKISSNSAHCLFGGLPSASTRVRHSELGSRLIHWSLRSNCRTCQFAERPNLRVISCRPRLGCEMT